MKAIIKMNNSVENQNIARQIRNANREESNVDISFNQDLTEIIFKSECIWIPNKEWLTKEMSIEGRVTEKDNGYEIIPQDKGKTVNLRLDAGLVAELNQVRNHVMDKTQHDIVLELFKKGLDQYNKENT